MDRENKLNQSELDFEKMNATLSDPNFANWYYHQIVDNNDKDIDFSIEHFVQIINDYKLN